MRMSKLVIRIANRLLSLNISLRQERIQGCCQGNGIPIEPKCYRCYGFGYMKQECPIYLKSIGKSKALAATLSDSEPEVDSDEVTKKGL